MPWTQLQTEQKFIAQIQSKLIATAIGKYGFGEKETFSRLAHFQLKKLKKQIWGEESLFKDRPFPTKETQETDYSRSGLKSLKSQETDNQSELRRNKGLVRARSFQP